MTDPQFVEFPKIYRLHREWIASEKIDGTNACVAISDSGEMWAQSRNKIITPEQDNAGFAKWVKANEAELAKLGPGHHFGEFYGAGIQRGYGLKEKRFALFNSARWADDAVRPTCCGVVPVLARGLLVNDVADRAMSILRERGSVAVPGFMNPEGIVLFHEPSHYLLKVTLTGDESPKSLAA